MDTLLIVLLSLLIILVIALTGVVIALGIKILKGQNSPASNDHPNNLENLHEDAKALLDDARTKANENELIGHKCVDHPELEAKGLCSITDETYCELCITKEKDIRFARKLINLVLDSEWETAAFFLNEELGAEKLNELYKVKKELWKEQNLPLITQKQYKINIENDQIEAYTMVMGRVDDKALWSEKLSFLD